MQLSYAFPSELLVRRTIPYERLSWLKVLKLSKPIPPMPFIAGILPIPGTLDIATTFCMFCIVGMLDSPLGPPPIAAIVC